MVAEKITEYRRTNPTKSKQKVPDALIWEVLDGQPLYRRGYKDVLRKLKTIEEIMGTSSYQSILNSYIARILFQHLDENQYDILNGEPRIHLEKNDNISNDIVVHEILSPDRITTKYADYPPKLVVEIDIDIDPESMPEIEYLQKKTSKMLDFGVERVVWVLTYVRKVIVADRLKDTWLMVDWASDIELMNGIFINIHQFLQKRGINPDAVQKTK